MKRFLPVITLILTLTLLFGACAKGNLEGDISGFSATVSIIDREVPDFTVDEKGDFTILQFTDTHFINGETKNDRKTLDAIKRLTEEQKPDLVVVSGDMIEGNNSKRSYNKQNAIDCIAGIFEDLKQYWAYVPGNNDGEMCGSSADVSAYLSQYDYCILSNEKDLTGAVQYAVDLKDSEGKLLHSLIFMDSLARDENNKYDYMKADQIKWAQDTVNEKKAQNPDVFFSFFFHMNTPNFAISGKNGKPYSESYAPVPKTFFTGIDGNAAFDKAIEGTNTGLVSIGHVHPDTNYCSYLNGTYYHVTRPSGYLKSKNPGSALITVHTSAPTSEEMYDFSEILF